MPERKSIYNKLSDFVNIFFLPLVVILIIFISALSYFFVLKPKYGSIMNSVNSSKKDMREVISGKKKFLTELKNYIEDFDKIDKYNLTKLNKMLPKSLDIANVINSLNSISEKNGFILEDIKYLDETKTNDELDNSSGNIKSADFLATISGGDYNELKSFLRMAAENVNLIDIVAILFDGSMSYDLEFKMYYIDGLKIIEAPKSGIDIEKKLFSRKSFLNLKEHSFINSIEPADAMFADEFIPPPITEFIIQDPGVGDRLNLFWENLPSNITNKIKVYRFEGEDGKGEIAAELNKDATFFIDKGLLTNKTYYYLVKTASEKNIESKNTKKYFGTPANTIPPAGPFDIKIKKSEKGLEISWANSADYDLEYIYIYKSRLKDVLGELSAKILAYKDKKQSWEDIEAESYSKYYYTLVAQDSAGNRSPDQVIKFNGEYLFEIKKEE
ncbi:MAG: hypothetical protein V1891_01755 [bacterium]